MHSFTLLTSRIVEGEGLTLRNNLLLSGFSVFSGYDTLWEVVEDHFLGETAPLIIRPIQIRPYSLNECGFKPTSFSRISPVN